METISAELSRNDPSAFPDVETVTLENGKSVIALRVPEGGGFYTYDDRPYIRTGPTKRVMPREEYERRLMADSIQPGDGKTSRFRGAGSLFRPGQSHR